MEMQTMMRINRAIEYIKRDSEFPFDIHDDLDEILAYYDIDREFDPEAKAVIASEVRGITEAAQTMEIARLVTEEIGRLDGGDEDELFV